MYHNKHTIIGNLTRKPELEYPKSKKGSEFALCKFGVAANKPKSENAFFIEVVVFGAQAEACAEYLDKGAPVFIEGEPQYDSWEDKEGNFSSKIYLKANDVQFLPRKEKSKNESDNDTDKKGNRRRR